MAAQVPPTPAQSAQAGKGPPFAQIMPWVLVLAGAAVLIWTAVTLDHRFPGSKTQTTKVTKSPCRKNCSPATARRRCEAANKKERKECRLLVTKQAQFAAAHTRKVDVTTTATTTQSDKTYSDALIGVLFGLGAVLVLAGAFYTRITKIALPGGSSIEMAAEQEAATVATAVAAKSKDAIATQLAATEGPPDEAQFADLAARAASAAAVAQRQVALARVAAAEDEPHAAPVTLRPEDVQRVQRGMPLSNETLDRLASSAVAQVFDRP